MKLLLSLFLVGFCASNAFAFGLMDRSKKWDKPILTVCWVDEAEKQLTADVSWNSIKIKLVDELITFPSVETTQAVEKAVTDSFQNAGIQFSGWKKCSETVNADVLLIYSDEMPLFSAAIGKPDAGQTKTGIRISGLGYSDTLSDRIKETRQYVVENRVEKLKQYAQNNFLYLSVHEFGHVAGLEHEHLRTDGMHEFYKSDLSFKQMGSTDHEILLDYSIRQGYLKDMEKIGSYDPFSLMNYMHDRLFTPLLKVRFFCELNPTDKMCIGENWKPLMPESRGTRGFFSEGDVETLRFVYLQEEPKGLWKKESQRLVKWLLSIQKRVSREEF